jgi:hypothetical protein
VVAVAAVFLIAWVSACRDIDDPPPLEYLDGAAPSDAGADAPSPVDPDGPPT